jgi:hypothetical protein
MSDLKSAVIKLTEAVEAQSREIEQIESDVSQIPAITSALSILNSTLMRLAIAVEDASAIAKRSEISIGFARASIEAIQKNGCRHGCGCPDDGEPTNPEALTQLHAVHAIGGE